MANKRPDPGATDRVRQQAIYIMPELLHILICAGAVFLGGILQGCLGFGFAFISLPVFAVFIAPAVATPVIVILSLILNLIVISSCLGSANRKIIIWMLVGGIAGTPVGAQILRHVDASAYSLLAGVVITGAAILFLFEKRCPLTEKIQNYISVGLVSGILNASIGLSGPPVVLFLSNQAIQKDVIRATMIGYFLLINGITLVWFIHQQLITGEVLACMQYFAPVVIIGTIIGIMVSRFIAENFFRKIVLLLVAMIGSVVIAQSLI